MSHRDDTGVALDEILIDDIVLSGDKLGPARICEFRLYLEHLGLDDLLDASLVVKIRGQLLDQRVELREPFLDFLSLESGKTAESHVDYRLSLYIVEGEARHQLFLRVRYRRRLLYDLDDLVDIVGRDTQTLEDMRLALRLFKVELYAAGYDVFLMLYIITEYLLEVQHARHVVDEREHIERAGILKLGVLVELIQYDLTVGVAAVIDNYPHSVPSGLVADIRDALDALVLDERRHRLDEHTLVHLIRYLGDDDTVLLFLDIALRADHDSSASGRVRLIYAVRAVKSRRGREIRSFYELHEVPHRAVRVLHLIYRSVDDLAEVVRRDICRHTDSDTDRAVHEQVRETRREYSRLFQAVIEVRVEVDDVLVDIRHHLVRELRESRLGITVSRRGVSVDRTEVSVSLDQRISHREGLSETHHRIVNR